MGSMEKNVYHRISINENCMISIFLIDIFFRKTFKKVASFSDQVRSSWPIFHFFDEKCLSYDFHSMKMV